MYFAELVRKKHHKGKWCPPKPPQHLPAPFQLLHINDLLLLLGMELLALFLPAWALAPTEHPSLVPKASLNRTSSSMLRCPSFFPHGLCKHPPQHGFGIWPGI